MVNPSGIITCRGEVKPDLRQLVQLFILENLRSGWCEGFFILRNFRALRSNISILMAKGGDFTCQFQELRRLT